MNKLVLLAVLAACGGSRSAAPAMLGIGELRFYDGDQVVLRLQPDGKVEELWSNEMRPLGTIRADGTLTAPDGKSAHLLPDGTLQTPTSPCPRKAPDITPAPRSPCQPIPAFKLAADEVVIGPNVVTIDAQGAVLVNGKQMSREHLVRVEGTTPATRRTALLLIAIVFGGEQSP